MDSEVGRPWAGSSLMIHGNWVDPDIGMAIARGLKAHRFRLADSDPRVLLRWADRSYGFSSHRPKTILPHAQPSRNQNRSALQHYALSLILPMKRHDQVRRWCGYARATQHFASAQR
ncbi:hypothetical protein ACVIW2_000201 [Bradyrhizobium huanghuaihaiense]|uniref:Uncharacterized protein n=1 Tax=Bradyrhizobium barranii subsp. barranii TaxID=2823807 RepID=A0A7Z0TU99_9BRAD|nr:hypothetical protein [Bradyrhizobium barranii]UGX89667.1 hypothetical protein G6321_00000800 [Bradyrhizobium barranii subsp. barranii]